MRVKLTGKALSVSSFHSSKNGKDYLLLDVFDGNDSVRVFGVPPLYESVGFGDDVSFDVRVSSGEKGLFVAYDDVR